MNGAARWGAALLLLPMLSGCMVLLGPFVPGWRLSTTEATIVDIRGAIHAFEREHQAVPDSLAQLCPPPGTSACPPGDSRDGWGTRLVYRRLNGSSYELRSAGPDRRPFTGDDVVVNRAEEEAAVERLQGCYDLASGHLLVGGRRLVLSPAERGPGSFRVHLELPGYREPSWEVNPPDRVRVYWREQHSGLVMDLAAADEGLRGTVFRVSPSGRGPGTEMVARRAACTP
ncbi:hypothetical protein [Longimicrobium sp.]|jgi:hypothetical protein|uniref:hypothetical protein n=1 Tax=Longimicrobium sp. TaxID=2029185 RepID=UPI002ED91C69